MKRTALTAFAALTVSALAATADTQSLTEADVTDLMTAWGDGIVKIGAVFSDSGDDRAAAQEHIAQFYADGQKDILFKPTLASADQFRGTFDEALSYFVGGDIAEDGGFAIAPYTNVRWENEGTLVAGDTAMAMGTYVFTKTDGNEVKVEYTFGVERMEDDSAKVVLHHSSLPFMPN